MLCILFDEIVDDSPQVYRRLLRPPSTVSFAMVVPYGHRESRRQKIILIWKVAVKKRCCQGMMVYGQMILSYMIVQHQVVIVFQFWKLNSSMTYPPILFENAYHKQIREVESMCNCNNTRVCSYSFSRIALLIRWAGSFNVLNSTMFHIFVKSLNDGLKAIFQNLIAIVILGEVI